MHNFIWVSNTMPKFRKNYWCNSKKLSGQTDGHTTFHRTLPATTNGFNTTSMAERLLTTDLYFATMGLFASSNLTI